MTDYRTLWWNKQRKKYPDLTDDQIRDKYREFGAQGKKTGKGGFYNNPDLARKAGEKRWQKQAPAEKPKAQD